MFIYYTFLLVKALYNNSYVYRKKKFAYHEKYKNSVKMSAEAAGIDKGTLFKLVSLHPLGIP